MEQYLSLEQVEQRRKEQLTGLRNLFTKVFSEYYGKNKEWPILDDEAAVERFIELRPELKRMVDRLGLVLEEASEVALNVLRGLQREQEQKNGNQPDDE